MRTHTETQESRPVDPALAHALEDWREKFEALAPFKGQLAQARKAEGLERKAREEVGRLVDAPAVAIQLDDTTYVYERGERGGGDPDYAQAWEDLYREIGRIEGGEAWQARMVEILGEHRTEATVTHKLTAIPTGQTAGRAPAAAGKRVH